MSDDWQVGDLALCVDDAPCRCGCGANLRVRSGTIYRVERVQQYRVNSFVCLILEGVDAAGNHQRGTNQSRFRKIRPDEHEPCEVEFVELLNRSKVPVARSEAAAVGGR